MKLSRLTSHHSIGTTLTPMLDMFTTMLIFLIVSFAPEESRVMKSAAVVPPESSLDMKKLPALQIEVSTTDVKVNGAPVEGIRNIAETPGAWSLLKGAIQKISKEPQAILLIADEKSDFGLVDATLANLAQAGFGNVLLLTRKREGQN